MNKKIQVSANASPLWKKFAMGTAASAVVVAGLASAANVDPIPTISNTFAVAGEVVKSADINKLAESINLLDVRTNNFKDNVTVTDDGRVGIGTTSPSEKLELKNNNSTSSLDFIKMTNMFADQSAGAKGLMGGITFGYDNNEHAAIRMHSNQYYDNESDISFWTHPNSGVMKEAVRITDTGNVGIGTSSPGAKLEISNTSLSSSAIKVNNSNGNQIFVVYENDDNSGLIGLENNDGSKTINFSTKGIAPSYINANNFGIGTTSPTAKLHVDGDALATVWNTTSDERKKENIEVVEDALDKISEIEGVSFTWKDGGLETYGLIAQNVETVFPELVTTADDEMGTKSVNYDGMVGPLVEAVKELKAENDDLRARLDAAGL